MPIEDWKVFETYGRKDLETLKYMFGFCQYSGGKYYGELNNLASPKELKEAAARAKGKPEEVSLQTLEGFFEANFGAAGQMRD